MILCTGKDDDLDACTHLLVCSGTNTLSHQEEPYPRVELTGVWTELQPLLSSVPLSTWFNLYASPFYSSIKWDFFYTLLGLTHGWKILCITIINYNYHFLCICHESCRASSAVMINLKTGICSSTTDILANNLSITQIPCLLMWDSNYEKH